MDLGAVVGATLAGVMVAVVVAAPMLYVWLAAQNTEPDELATLPGAVASVGLVIPLAIGVAGGVLVAGGNVLAGFLAPVVGVAAALALLLGPPLPKRLEAAEIPLWVSFLLAPALAAGAMVLANALL